MTQDTKINIISIGVGLLIGAVLIFYKEASKSSTEIQPTFTFQTRPSNEFSEEQISQALDILKSACPALFKSKAILDIEKNEVSSYTTEGFYLKEAYGWNKMLDVNIELKNDTKYIPDEYRAWGHTLHFYLGSGQQSGVVTQKRQAQEICGWEVSPNGDDMIHIVPKLNILK